MGQPAKNSTMTKTTMNTTKTQTGTTKSATNSTTKPTTTDYKEPTMCMMMAPNAEDKKHCSTVGKNAMYQTEGGLKMCLTMKSKTEKCPAGMKDAGTDGLRCYKTIS